MGVSLAGLLHRIGAARTAALVAAASAIGIGAIAGVVGGTSQSHLKLWLAALLLIGAACALYITWRRPLVGLIVLIVGVPFQEFVLARAFAAGVGFSAISLARFWKEGVLLVLVVRLLKERGWRWSDGDRVPLAYLGLVAVYLVLPVGAPLNIRVLGARSLASFLVVFLVARHLSLPDHARSRVENWILAVGVVVAALGIWNSLDAAAWSSWIASTKLIEYQTAISGGRLISPVVWYTIVGGRKLVSAGSIFLSPLVLPYYLTVPITIALSRLIGGRARTASALAGGVCMIGLLFTLSRSAIALMPAIALLAFAASRQRAKLLVVAVFCVALLVPVVGSLTLGQRLGTALNAQDPSTAGHIERARASIERVNAHPLGTGLGSIATFDQSGSGSQQAESVIFNEDWYLEVGTEVGYVGTALILFAFVFVLRQLWRRGRKGNASALAALCALAWVAMACLVLQVFSDINVSWTLWMAAGLALREPPVERPKGDAQPAGSHDDARARPAFAPTARH
jgi:hypothetical protein